MAAFGQTFDSTQEEERTEFAALDPGDYPVMITDSVFEPTAKGTGQFLKLSLTVLDGPGKGSVLFDRLNLQNPNEVAVKIARETLAEICRSVGRLSCDDSNQLHNVPMVAKVAKVPRKDKSGALVPGEWSNEVKRYYPAGGGSGAAAAPATKPAFVGKPAAPAAAGGKPAWMKAA